MYFRSLPRPVARLAMVLILFAPARSQINPGVIGGLMGGMAATLSTPGNPSGAAVSYALDSSAIRPDVFRRIALRQGFHEMPGDSGSPCFEYRDPWKWQARVCFRAEATAWKSDEKIAAAPWLSSDSIQIRKDRIFARIVISGEAHGNPGFPLAFWMLAAYLRELHPDLPSDSVFFVPPERKSVAGYRWRNTVSMGWGVRYGTRGNPFISQAGLAEGLGYLFDAITGIMIIGGPFFGHHRVDRVAIPFIGLGTGVFLRFTIFNSWNLQPAFTLLNSGYPIPRALTPKASIRRAFVE